MEGKHYLCINAKHFCHSVLGLFHWNTYFLHTVCEPLHLLRSQVSSSRSRVCFQSLKAIVTPECLLVLDFRGFGLDKWLVLELGPQLAGEGTLVTYSLPFEFRALEALLQHRVG